MKIDLSGASSRSYLETCSRKSHLPRRRSRLRRSRPPPLKALSKAGSDDRRTWQRRAQDAPIPTGAEHVSHGPLTWKPSAESPFSSGRRHASRRSTRESSCFRRKSTRELSVRGEGSGPTRSKLLNFLLFACVNGPFAQKTRSTSRWSFRATGRTDWREQCASTAVRAMQRRMPLCTTWLGERQGEEHGGGWPWLSESWSRVWRVRPILLPSNSLDQKRKATPRP